MVTIDKMPQIKPTAKQQRAKTISLYIFQLLVSPDDDMMAFAVC